jgi:hypothetical protein
MIETSSRPLTDAERRVLEADIGARGSLGDALLAGGFVFAAVLGGLLIVLPSSWEYGVRSLVPAVVGAVAGALVFWRVRRSTRRSHWQAAVRSDLDRGLAEVTTYGVQEAIAVEEAEDEGSHYFLRLTDGRVLFLSGQYLYEAEDGGLFPNSVFTIIRAPASGLVLDLKCAGEAYPASSTRACFSEADHLENRVPEDGEVLDVEFESLRDD